jgi:peptidoglycan hydrolase-like protein with peptidoglycan-binding domain
MIRPELQVGSSGPAVRELQTLLGQHGYPVTVDGIFGQQTAAAVRAFQKAKGLVVDGIVGPQTWGALLGTPVPGLRAPELTDR